MALGLLLLKLVLLPFAQTTDPDAIVRVLHSQKWSLNPEWIGADVWGPFNYYLHGIGIWLVGDRVLAPTLISVLLSVLVVFPVFHLNRKFLSPTISLGLVLVLSCCTMMFRNSFMAMSEIPYVFLIAWSGYFLIRFFENENLKDVIYCACSITLAAGFRYEAWALMFCFFVMLTIRKKIAHAFLFAVIAGVFPLVWMISNHYYTGDFLFSLKGNAYWTQEVMKTNENVSWESWLRRIWFLPFSFLVALGPIFAFLFVRGFKGLHPQLKIWIFPLLFMFSLLFYNSVNGTLLHHHRFILTIVLLALPFIGNAISNLNSTKSKQMLLGIGFPIMVLGTFVYNTDRIALIPRISDQSITEARDYIIDKASENPMLLIDFMQWDNTYYLGYTSKLKPEKILFIDGFELEESRVHKLEQFNVYEGLKILVVRKDNVASYDSIIATSQLELVLEGDNYFLYH